MAIIVVIVAIIVVARLLKTINGWISEPYHHWRLQVITKYVVYPFLTQSTDKTMIGFEQSFLFLVIS